ncbi:MAG: hypothetical protein ABIE70_02135 [bacterium]
MFHWGSGGACPGRAMGRHKAAPNTRMDDGDVNIADLVGLVNYMFGDGFELVPCPS